jgi:tRNA(Ile)-lysidine synthase
VAPSKRSLGGVARVAYRALELAGVRGVRVAVGLSGGVDSVVLLHCLTRIAPFLDLSLRAVHVHHGLSRHADVWAQFCERLCGELGVECSVARVRVARRSKLGLEAAARAARYAVLRAQDVEWVALAHHQDDQAETLLLQLLRGAGVRGLSAMPEVRALDAAGRIKLVRPLLDATRAQIVAYANEARLAWVEDESNADLSIDRNFLRAQVMPVLAQRFPSLTATLQRAAQNAGDAAHLLDDLAQVDASSGIDRSGIQISVLERLSAARAGNLLRWFLEQGGVRAPPRARLHEALRQALHARSDAQLEVSIGDAVLRRHRGRLCIEPTAPAESRDWVRPWRGEPRLALPRGLGAIQFERATGAGLSLQRLQAQPTVVRPRSGGERIRLTAGRPTRTLKNLLQEAGIPQWRRDRLPLMFCGADLVWIPELGIDARYAAHGDEHGVLPRGQASA